MRSLRCLTSSIPSPPFSQRRAADVLGKIGPAAAKVVPALIEALRDADSDVRSRAAYALDKIRPAAADTDQCKRFDGALGKIGPAAIPALIETLRGADRDVRRCSADALSKIGPAAIPALIETLRGADTKVRGCSCLDRGPSRC
jgi:HEAT repeat protein